MLLQHRHDCPACGHPNGPSRRSCKRCRAALPGGGRAGPSRRTFLLLAGLSIAALLLVGLFVGLVAFGIPLFPADLVIEVENRTGSTVEVAFEGERRRVLGPGETDAIIASSYTLRAPVRIAVRDQAGRVLLDQAFTYQDLERRLFRIVVE